jgi:Fe2+ or Zn2+ uptake regulation protein
MPALTFGELQTEHQRLSILRLLEEAADYSINTSLLNDALDALGLPASRDKVETMVAWLTEQGLVTVRQIGGVTVATITRRGSDTAKGNARIPGVKRPSAGE